MVCLSGFKTFNTHTYNIYHTCTSCVFYAYFILRIYALVGRAISIRDPLYLCRSPVCANESHAVFHRPVVCAVKKWL